MTVVLVLLAGIMFFFVGWLVSQSIGAQPWIASASGPAMRQSRLQAQPNAKVGLVVLLAVLSSMFALFVSAYVLRMELADWRPLNEPDLLWLNTAILTLASVGMHGAYVRSGAGDVKQVQVGLLFAGLCLGLFVLGQMVAWDQLSTLGYYATSNPANAFFYLITGLHVVHIVGGLVVWTLTTKRALRAENTGELRLQIQLCGIYIHFLLIVWFVLFALLLQT
jgi:cytochrome c oxidase subunit 3